MSSSDFRDILHGSEAGKAERLFRAAVSAFCALTRPSRRDVVQLDALTLPLYDQVSVDALRYVAAALSECTMVPGGLLSRLCDEPVDIGAPLLIRSPALADVALIDLVARHGIPHARAIARRPDLNPTIAQLIRALEGAVAAEAARAAKAVQTAMPQPPVRRSGADAVRDRLRAIMCSADEDEMSDEAAEIVPPDPAVFVAVRDAALSGEVSVFVPALAAALKLTPQGLRERLEAGGLTTLLVGLRALGLREEEAFLVGVVVYPEEFQAPAAVRLFLERYRAMNHGMARERVKGWKIEMVAAWVRENVGRPRYRPI